MDLKQLLAYETKSTALQEDDDERTAVGHYIVLRELGRGTFGRVVLAKQKKTGQLAAIKLLPRGSYIGRYCTYVGREICHQASLRHPFIVGLREVILTRQNLAIVMEFASGGTLTDHLKARKNLGEGEVRWLFQQLILALDFCHRMGVANRDLKLDHLLLGRRSAGAGAGEWPLLKICDFGYSKHDLNSSAKTSVGTPLFMAPEVIGNAGTYSAKLADVWSCGVILYMLLFGAYPFDPESNNYAVAIIRGQWSIPASTSVSQEAQHLVKRMMTLDPLQRIDVQGIMQHPWFARALPAGAAAMNDVYLAQAPRLEGVVAAIDEMVQAAESEGLPWARPQVVTLDDRTSSGSRTHEGSSKGGDAAQGSGSMGGCQHEGQQQPGQR